jgi:dihydrofolate reductase
MARIIVSEFVSLDGVMEAPGGDDGFVRGPWSFQFSRGEEGDKFKVDETMNADALFLGRRTYEGFADAWPSRDGEFADKFNSMRKYVLSTMLTNPTWTNTTVLDGDIEKAVAQIHEAESGNVVVHGSAQLVQGLVQNDLADELRLMVFPVVLGTGKRLFADTDEMKTMKLTSSQVVGDGVTIMIYEPQRG